MDQKEINKILIQYKKMIEVIASKKYNTTCTHLVDKEDFIQEAFVLASKYLQNYNSTKGGISTFLYANLSKALIRFECLNKHIVHVPIHVYDRAHLINKYCKQNMINPEYLSIADIKELVKCDNCTAQYIKRFTDTESLVKSADFNNTLEMDQYYQVYSNIENKLDKELLTKKILKYLSREKPRDINFFIEFYVNNVKLKDLETKYNMPLGSISEAIRRTKVRLKKELIKSKEDFLYE